MKETRYCPLCGPSNPENFHTQTRTFMGGKEVVFHYHECGTEIGMNIPTNKVQDAYEQILGKPDLGRGIGSETF